jgi:adenylate cyclase
MIDAVSTYQTVLLIRLETSAMPDRAVSSAAPAQRAEQLSFVESALRDCGAGRVTPIGDNALVVVFPTADSALAAACSVQRACREFGDGSALTDVRILVDGTSRNFAGDDAQDRMNGLPATADQMIQQVPAGQIFATRVVASHLSELSHARFRLHEPDPPGAADTQPSQVICNEETVTRLAIPAQYHEKSASTPSLSLRWRENTMTLVPESPSLTIGRGDQSDIQIESELVSRIHARLGFQQTNFILTDQSTNGTFVQIDDDDEVYLHHEQIVLRGSGVIGLGRRIRAGKGKLIYFKLAS